MPITPDAKPAKHLSSGALIVSCQADPGTPLSCAAAIGAMAEAALAGGAAGIRADGPDHINPPPRGPTQPHLKSTFLSFEILAEMGMPLLEQDIQVYDVVNADEAWVPTTPYCLGPVVRLNGTEIGNGRPGPMWRRILDRWSEIAGKDIYREIVDSEAP